MELYCYRPTDVLKIAQNMQRDWEALNKDERSHNSDQLVFRDDRGEYWTVNMDSLHWYRNVRNKWARSDSAPKGILEGPFSVSTPNILPLRKSHERRGRAPKPKTEVESVEEVIRSDRDVYRDGEITSTAAEALAREEHLIGKDGVAWTVGLQTGDWYRFADGNWRKSPRPEPGMLTHYENTLWCPSCKRTANDAQYCGKCGKRLIPKLAEATQDAYTALTQYYASGLTHLPEPITEPWTPPDSPRPDSSETATGTTICRHCGSTLPSDLRFCTKCGAPTSIRNPEPATSKQKRSEGTKRPLPATRMMLGILLGAMVSAPFPYLYYLLAKTKLDPTVSLAVIFGVSLLIAFGILAYSLKTRKARKPPT
jgi:ribosomal protein L40E